MRLSVIHLRSSTGLYGAEQVVLELCRQQSEHYASTRLLVFAPVGAAPGAMLTMARSRHLSASALACHGPLDLRCIARLRRLLRADLRCHRVVLHCHDYKSVVYGGLAALGLPLTRIATLHGWLDDSWRLRLYHWLEARMLRHFQRVCAVSESIFRQLLKRGLEPEMVCRVDNGIDIRRFQPRPLSASNGPTGPLLLGTAARLSPEKHLGLLIAALAECRDRGRIMHLMIVGEGPERARLEQQIRQLQLSEQVSMPGSVVGLEGWYPTLDAFVLPSLSEGMPLSVLEALACGCPVIASAVGSIPELLEGVSGCRTVPPGDGQALIEALLALPEPDRPLLAARERVARHYSGERMATRYAGIYRAAILA
jgi:glycosyltransferase involved in cell wall biosynthesis